MGLGAASNDDVTEKDMANHACIVDSYQTEPGNERGRLAQSLNETRFVWPTECQLIDLEDFPMIPRSLRPDRDHAPLPRPRPFPIGCRTPE